MRYNALEKLCSEADLRYESLKKQVTQTQTGWTEYYAKAIEDVKMRFEEIDRDAILGHLKR